MRILIVTPDYPDSRRSVYTFVKQLVDQFAVAGHECCVVTPYSITRNRKCIAFREVQKIDNNTRVIVLRPNYLSFSRWQIAGFQPSSFFRKLALKRALQHLPFTPDVIYAHFWRSGREIYSYAKLHHIPLFVACGESVIPKDDISPQYHEYYDYVSGVICVSKKNMEESITNGMTIKEKCLVAPNAINPQLFYQRDRQACRKGLGFDNDIFIVAFCGVFCRRKGVRILSNAIEQIKGRTVYSIFIGRKGDELPSCCNILYQGEVAHEEVATYLSSADVFVLPTLHEGCSNAIIEAMACGLPIISSDRSFNDDILDETNSILVDPESEDDIINSIIRLRDDRKLRESLSRGAINTAKRLTIGARRNRILNFITERLDGVSDINEFMNYNPAL